MKKIKHKRSGVSFLIPSILAFGIFMFLSHGTDDIFKLFDWNLVSSTKKNLLV